MMSAQVAKLAARWSCLVRRTLFLAWGAWFWLESSPLALAKGKKAEVVVETKSWVLSYMIVGAFVALGLMTICRPSRRADKPPEKGKDEDD